MSVALSLNRVYRSISSLDRSVGSCGIRAEKTMMNQNQRTLNSDFGILLTLNL